jgi:hypothetical protein
VSAADTNGDGTPELFVGSGSYNSYNLASNRGALYSFTAGGALRWRVVEPSPGAAYAPTYPDSPVHSTPVIGDIVGDGVPDVYAGTLGLQSWAFNEGGNPLPGAWPYYQNDTIFSSPALADVTGIGHSQLVVGGDASPAPGNPAGGRLRILDGGGNAVWQFNTDEIIRSSPAVGKVAGNGQNQIVFGTGDYWLQNHASAGLPVPQDSTRVFVLNPDGTLHCRSADLTKITFGSPALADVNGDGRLDIVIGTELQNTGDVWALDGNTCQEMWHTAVPGGSVYGGVVTANLDGNAGGAQDVLVPTGAGVYAYNGRTGTPLFTIGIGDGISYANSPLVVDEGSGRLAIYLAGTNAGSGNGIVSKYILSTGAGIGASAWPMFHKDARHTGSWTNPPLAQNLCTTPGGYWEVAADGGIFSYCSAAFHGSTGAIRLAQPIVGMAPTPDGGGYWLVASDGGIFAFGNATFYGSTGNLVLAKPIVGMTPTPDGGGYWLVASDGGIFAFGNATFYGSTGNLALVQPVVGMSTTPTGHGYWLVARDGGIFAYGDARFVGSTGAIQLAQPIVGMARTSDGGGYWFVASDGGIFAFGNAPFYGSTGNIHLNQPIVAMSATPNGHGYWLAAADGGIFSFGNAPFFGSAGGIRIARPVVGIAGRS